jgi:hypothetical protein
MPKITLQKFTATTKLFLTPANLKPRITKTNTKKRTTAEEKRMTPRHKTMDEHKKENVTYAVLRIAGWTLYSFANTKGTIPCGRAAYQLSNEYPEKRILYEHYISHREINLLNHIVASTTSSIRVQYNVAMKMLAVLPRHKPGPRVHVQNLAHLTNETNDWQKSGGNGFSLQKFDYSRSIMVTWTMATRKSVPRRPMARDAAAMTAGPVRKRTTMEWPAAR